jgi:hypothetical protein
MHSSIAQMMKITMQNIDKYATQAQKILSPMRKR